MVLRVSKNIETIPFSVPTMVGHESAYLHQCINTSQICANEGFTQTVRHQLVDILNKKSVYLLQSCTAALEVALLALDLKPGDEVILPSFTFPSTANAIALRGAVPFFVDISEDDLNIDVGSIQQAITHRTKAIIVVHYAGSAADMTRINELAKQHKIAVVEDSAQCIGATYLNQHLGTFGTFGALSFHATKNITCGQGGALIVNETKFQNAIEIIINKGTNREQFLRNEVSKYSWVGLGSSYLLGELQASILQAQLPKIQAITKARVNLWNYYFDELSRVSNPRFRLPQSRAGAAHNGHIFYIQLLDKKIRDKVLHRLKLKGIQATSHFEPLHNSSAGLKYGKMLQNLENSKNCSSSLIRLPIWHGMQRTQQDRVLECLVAVLNES